MDTIIKHIIDIDKRANEIIIKTQERIKESEKETKSSMEAMRSDIINEAKSEANNLYESAISEAKAEAEKIRDLSEKECYSIGIKFSSLKEELEGEIFKQILDKNMRYSDE